MRRNASWRLYISRVVALLLVALLTVGIVTKAQRSSASSVSGQKYQASESSSADSSRLHYPVKHTVSPIHASPIPGEHPADLRDPENITTTVEYDPDRGMYVVHTKLGDADIVTPYLLSPEEYNRIARQRDMFAYFRSRNAEPEEVRKKEPFNVLDMNFNVGALDRIFGPGGVKLTTSGSVQLSMGVKTNRTDNPALPLKSRRKTYFDFDQKVQANINASVGEKLNFSMTYNTDATFDFDSKNLRLSYEGTEDEIIKSIEAGNVGMTTGSSLMRGSSSLFGVKAKLQFGKLTLTGLVSQQNSESKSVSTKGGVQTTKFSIKADDYDANRHFFLAQYFYDNYDDFAARLPNVSSGIKITRIEVWVTNKRSNYNESRNFVGFADLGENSRLASSYWTPDASLDNPSNRSNNLLEVIKKDYPGARNINTVTQALAPLGVYGIIGGKDYEKVESARKLEDSEFTLNSTLGYISLKSALTSDEVLAVAYEYTLNGKVYQVGEFSGDVTSTDQSIYLKMLRSTDISAHTPVWKLMMKNIYSTGAYQIQKSNFRMQVKFLSDTTGTEINYLPIGDISNKPLLQVMNLDRLDSNGESNPDGLFDFIEGYTIDSSTGKIIFPVAEPFGKNLEKKIGNPALAEKYVYKELYDSTLVVARQFADKNKFSLTGEYQASSGAQIRLNATNVPRGSVVVMAGGVKLTENVDYTVDYTVGIVTITNQSIIDAGTSISVTLENQSMFNMQRKTLLGLDAQYKFSPELTIGATVMRFSEKALTEKVAIGSEVVNNTMWGVNFAVNKQLPWLTNLINKIPTVNATAPSSITMVGEFAQLIPSKHKNNTAAGSSYIDDFETTQTGIDLRSPYAWQLASTPFDNSQDALFPEAALSNDIAYGKNRALLSWYYIDRMWTQKNSSMLPGYLRTDLEQLSNPYVREITLNEIFPTREVSYGESNYIQTLNLSFYPTERGPYNLDSENISPDGSLLFPERRWGGIMRKLDNTNFETANVEYLQFWLLDPFLDPNNNNREGGDLYFNFGDISEDILKDGRKTYENGNPVDGNYQFMDQTVWGRVSRQNSLTYAFDNGENSRPLQDLGLDGLSNEDEFLFPTYSQYLEQLRMRLSAGTINAMQTDPHSPLNDPAGDNYSFYRSRYYDDIKASILDRYKRYNGVEGNSLSPDQSSNPLYQSAKSVPDVEDINQDNTLNEYERYFQYHVSLRPEDLEVGRNYITDKQVSVVPTRNGPQEVTWYQFKIPLSAPEKAVGGITDFSTVRFARIFATGFKATTHMRFASLELVRGEWRDYAFNLNNRNDTPAEGELTMSVVNIEENAGRTPVNYVLPPGVSRIQDPGQAQALQLNEQSLSLKLSGIHAGDARGIYKNTQLDLRLYKKLQMWVHAENLIDHSNALRNGDFALFIRLGSDVKSNYYEYEIPLQITPPGRYSNMNVADREIVWPLSNYLDLPLRVLTELKTERNRENSLGTPGVGYNVVFSRHDGENGRNIASVLGNPSLSDIRVMMIGVRNKSANTRSGEIWINELRVTDFDEEGGWAANVNANLQVSDIASVNFQGRVETSGFGAVDQALSQRRMDTYSQYAVAVQADLGRVVSEKLKLTAPIYYSRTSEHATPKYNPLDQDILLKDALEAATTRQEKDSIKKYAITRNTVESFSVSGFRFARQSRKPKPWDPANFSASFSFNRRKSEDPTIEYQTIEDYRGAFQYSYSPRIKPWRPFAKIKGKDKNKAFLREWGLNWMFNTLQFSTTMSRYYLEEQTRSEIDQTMQLPVQVSKNFLWDRQLNIVWNFTQSLSASFSSNTLARIEETLGAVNKRLFPDKYKQWRDTVWSSIRSLGTPWNYNQNFTATYRAPFAKFPVMNFLTGQASYASVYTWNRGTTVDGINLGNTIQNQSTWNADARVNFEAIYNKVPYLQQISRRFSGSGITAPKQKPMTTTERAAASRIKRFERAYTLSPDSSTIVKHNLKSKKVKITAMADGLPIKLDTRQIDTNTIEILTRGDQSVKVTVAEVASRKPDGFLKELIDHSLRFLMMPRNFSFKFRETRSLSIPQFAPNVGNLLGQSLAYGPMAPGAGFAFGFYDETFVDRALQRGWLITDANQTSPAVWNHGKEFNFDLTLEPISCLRIQLTSNHTDNRTRQMQFMYADMPTIYTGSYLRTHVALASALRTYRASDGYASAAFTKFLDNIPVVAARVEAQYTGLKYPTKGFLEGSVLGGQTYDPEIGMPSATSSDILIPAFLAAYTGTDPASANLSLFPGLSAMMPNWRVTYDGLMKIPFFRNHFKAFTLSHAYQCTYQIGSYTSFLNWIGVSGDLGFVLNEQTQLPVPSTPYSISSVSINERFAPLIGLTATLINDLSINAEYRDTRTVSLNSAAGQILEAGSRQITVGAGYKIVGFNKFLRIKGKQTGISNDLSLNLELGWSTNHALIRRIETAYTQATQGTQTLSINFMASYVISRAITVSAFFDHQTNKPLVSASAFPTSNSNYGISVNINLAR